MEKILYVFDQEIVKAIQNGLNDVAVLKNSLQNLKVIEQKEEEHLTFNELLKECKCSRWKVEIYIRQGLIRYKKIGKKYYFPKSEVKRYFNGDLEVK